MTWFHSVAESADPIAFESASNVQIVDFEYLVGDLSSISTERSHAPASFPPAI